MSSQLVNVVSDKGFLPNIYKPLHSKITCHDAKFLVTAGTTGCHYDSSWFSVYFKQWWRRQWGSPTCADFKRKSPNNKTNNMFENCSLKLQPNILGVDELVPIGHRNCTCIKLPMRVWKNLPDRHSCIFNNTPVPTINLRMWHCQVHAKHSKTGVE